MECFSYTEEFYEKYGWMELTMLPAFPHSQLVQNVRKEFVLRWG